jgi:hypothetical protein
LVQQAFRHYLSFTPENPRSTMLAFGFVVVGFIALAQVGAQGRNIRGKAGPGWITAGWAYHGHFLGSRH